MSTETREDHTRFQTYIAAVSLAGTITLTVLGLWLTVAFNAANARLANISMCETSETSVLSLMVASPRPVWTDNTVQKIILGLAKNAKVHCTAAGMDLPPLTSEIIKRIMDGKDINNAIAAKVLLGASAPAAHVITERAPVVSDNIIPPPDAANSSAAGPSATSNQTEQVAVKPLYIGIGYSSDVRLADANTIADRLRGKVVGGFGLKVSVGKIEQTGTSDSHALVSIRCLNERTCSVAPAVAAYLADGLGGTPEIVQASTNDPIGKENFLIIKVGDGTPSQ